MLTFAILFFARDASADQVLERAATFRKTYPSLSVTYSVSNGHGNADAHMMFQGHVRCLVHYFGTGVDYWLSATPEIVREVNKPIRVYDEFPGGPNVDFPPSRISPFTKSIPVWLMEPDIRKFFPGKSEFKFVRKEVEGGASCDLVHARVTSSRGSSDIDIAIDETGRVRRFRSESEAMGVKQSMEWNFSHVDPLGHVSENAFKMPAPLGFVPYALPDPAGPIVTGQTFPRQGWRSAGGGTLDLVTRLGLHGGLVAVLGVDSPPSDQAQASLRRLGSSMPVVRLADGPRPTPSTEGCDPSGKLLAQVAAPNTPLFLLVDRTGKIKREWMGYDVDHAGKFEAEVVKAFKTP